MKHLGDICKINGAEIEIVDVITGGSPCQDLSIAGKRAGLAGARSGLFMEQIRIVKEMREHDRANGRTGDMVRPRFMVWENVPGAFSSNKGRDFAAVLEEIIRIAEPEAPDIEVPEKGWQTWGGYHDEVGGRWSVAWRVHDAQYWGVPQRRRRISVVADFGGDTAGEILFEHKSVSGYLAESGTVREGPSTGAEGGASYAVRIRGGCDGGGKGALVQEDKGGTLGIGKEGDPSPTLTAGDRHGVMCLNDQGGNVMGVSHDVSGTLRAQEHGHQPAVMAFAQNQREEVRNVGDKAVSLAAEVGMHCQTFVALDMSHACDVIRDCGEVAPSLQARMGTGGNQVPLTFAFGRSDTLTESDVASTQSARQGKSATDLVCAVDCRNFREGGETNGTLQAKSNGGISYNLQNTVRTGMIVRRLTPMECERLQGYPDGWTDIGEWMDSKGKRHKDADSPRYKALGNSIALPFWDFLAKRISAQYLRPVTMGSLFDGIGGFPLVFERHNGKGTARWASEIEEFPIAVTKLRFGTDRSVTAQ
jgi:DNA (cytosine-5)-methyltransferase 1